MEKLSLKRYLVFELLITFELMGVLAGCGKKEYQQEGSASVGQDFSSEEEYPQKNGEPVEQNFSIGEELQWKSDFGWQYFPQEESADSELAGFSGRVAVYIQSAME